MEFDRNNVDHALALLKENSVSFAQTYRRSTINFTPELQEYTKGLVVDAFMGRYRYQNAVSNVILLTADSTVEGQERQSRLYTIRNLYTKISNNHFIQIPSYVLIRNIKETKWELGILFLDDLGKDVHQLELEAKSTKDKNVINAKNWAIKALQQNPCL